MSALPQLTGNQAQATIESMILRISSLFSFLRISLSCQKPGEAEADLPQVGPVPSAINLFAYIDCKPAVFPLHLSQGGEETAETITSWLFTPVLFRSGLAQKVCSPAAQTARGHLLSQQPYVLVSSAAAKYEP